MEINLTKEQIEVRDTRGKNLLVSAAAGSGKTAVLVERILSIITDEADPCDIDKMLIVTFTKAAAFEMKKRIFDAIKKRREKDPSENLKRQSEIVHFADICTIDSFCNKVVKDHFDIAGISPGFSVCAEEELKILENDTLEELFNQKFEKGDSDFLMLCEYFSKKESPGPLKEMIRALHKASGGNPWPREWLYNIRLPFTEVDESKTPVYQDQMRHIRPQVEALSDLALEYSEILFAKKKEKNTFSFTDIEQICLSILRDSDSKAPTETAQALRSYYKHILIDEYQDSNELQEEILTSIVRTGAESNYFMVGDVKQSIYRFRKAKPRMFAEKYRAYKEGRENCKVVDLSANFRSRKEVTDFVNAVFEIVMHEDVGGVEYDEDAKLIPKVSYEGDGDYTTEFFYCLSTDPIFTMEGISSEAAEARLIAKKIKDIVQEGKFSYSDIAILHRSAKKVSDIYTEVLQAEGIPVDSAQTKGYFSNFEIETLLSLLKVINNPLDDIPLCSVLTNIYGFTKDELCEVRTIKRESKGSFYSKAFFERAKDEDAPQRIKDFVETLNNLREKCRGLKLYKSIDLVFRETGLRSIVMSMPEGDKRIKNVGKLMDLARSFENTRFGNLYDFISYVTEIKSYDVDLGGFMDKSSDSVKLLTIHKSKGLEFPVCILSGTAKTGKNETYPGGMIISDNYGVGFDLIDLEKSVRACSLHKERIKDLEKGEERGELQRLLYTALTRAKEKLIITACIKDEKKVAEDIISLDFEERMKAGDFLKLLMPAINTLGIKKERVEGSDLIKESLENKAKDRLFIELLGKNPPQGELYESLVEKIERPPAFNIIPGLKSKYSVSQIKERDLDLSQDEKRSREHFTGELLGENMPALRGTAVHRVMECIGFSDAPNVPLEIDGMVKAGLLGERDAGLVNAGQIERFFGSDLARRMVLAEKEGKLFREKTFVMKMKTLDIFPEHKDLLLDTDTTLIQGIIDAFFIEDGKIVLLDYKTDKVNNESTLSKRYKSQLIMYAEALTKATGLLVSESYLYSFELGKEILL